MVPAERHPVAPPPAAPATPPAAPATPTVVDALAAVWSSTVAACQGLTPAQWDLATECPGWSVRDQLSHLIGIERMLLGDQEPPPAAPVPEHVHNAIGEANEAWVDERRSRPGDQVLAEFQQVTARRLEILRTMPPAELDRVVQNMVGEMRLGDFLEIRLFDSWVHEQDIRRALGRPGGRGGAGEAGARRTVTRAMGKVVGKLVAPPEGTSVVWDVRDDAAPAPDPAASAGSLPPGSVPPDAVPAAGGFTVALEMRGGRAVRLDAPPEVPTARIAVDATTYLRLGCGRVTAVEALAEGGVELAGDRGLAMAVLEAGNFMF